MPQMRWFLLILLAVASTGHAAEAVWLDELDLSGVTQDWGSPQARKSVDGDVLRIGSQTFERGVGTHARSSIVIDLDRAVEALDARVGVDSAMGRRGSVIFRVLGDGKKLFETDTLRGGGEPVTIHVALAGVKRLELIVTDAGDSIDYDHADWADARLPLAASATTRP